MAISIWKRYGLSITLAALFLLTWFAQGIAQWMVVKNEAASHGQTATSIEFWSQFLSSTFENWQSEFLQLLTFVVLTAFLIHQGSHESKDGDERMEATINRIEKRLVELEGRRKS